MAVAFDFASEITLLASQGLPLLLFVGPCSFQMLLCPSFATAGHECVMRRSRGRRVGQVEACFGQNKAFSFAKYVGYEGPFLLQLASSHKATPARWMMGIYRAGRLMQDSLGRLFQSEVTCSDKDTRSCSYESCFCSEHQTEAVIFLDVLPHIQL